MEGSPTAWPRLSRTTIAAYNVAFASSAIQYETRDRAETLLPNPAAKINTPSRTMSANQRVVPIGRGGKRTDRKKLTGLSESNSETSNTHQGDASSSQKQIYDTGLHVMFQADICCELRDQKQEREYVNDGRLSIERSPCRYLQPESNGGILDQDV